MPNLVDSKLARISVLIGAMGLCVAAIALIPAFGQWLFPRAPQPVSSPVPSLTSAPSPTAPPKPTSAPSSTAVPNPTPAPSPTTASRQATVPQPTGAARATGQANATATGPTRTPIPLYPPYKRADASYLTPTPHQAYAIISNKLALSLKVYVDEVYRGLVDPTSSKTLLLDSFPVRVRWEVERRTHPDGRPMGDELSGIFYQVNSGDMLEVHHKVGGLTYFYPVMNNESSVDCLMAVNDGLVGEQRPGYILAHQSNVVAGYFMLYTNSNVTLYCGSTSVFWGVRTGQTQAPSPLSNIVDPNTGVVNLTYKP